MVNAPEAPQAPDDILNEVTSTDDAFLSASTPKELAGVELQPFSPMRQAVALALGMQGTNSTLFMDAVIMGFVCLRSPRLCLRLLRDKEQAVLDAFEWAEQQGWSIANFEPVRNLYERVTAEIAASTRARPKTEPASANGGLSPNGGARPVP